MSKADEVRETYQRMETHELAERLASGQVSELALKIGKDELARRGENAGTSIDKIEGELKKSAKSSRAGIWWGIVALIIAFRLVSHYQKSQRTSSPSRSSDYGSQYSPPSAPAQLNGQSTSSGLDSLRRNPEMNAETRKAFEKALRDMPSSPDQPSSPIDYSEKSSGSRKGSVAKSAEPVQALPSEWDNKEAWTKNDKSRPK